MTTAADVNAAIDAVVAAVSATATKVQGDLKAASDQIAALQAQLAAGGVITSADLDAIDARLATVATSLGNIEVVAAAAKK
jgi:hypothetical protein